VARRKLLGQSHWICKVVRPVRTLDWIRVVGIREAEGQDGRKSSKVVKADGRPVNRKFDESSYQVPGHEIDRDEMESQEHGVDSNSSDLTECRRFLRHRTLVELMESRVIDGPWARNFANLDDARKHFSGLLHFG
jgi:hypothetical protein